MGKWPIIILTVAWLVVELLGAFVPETRLWPLTRVIVTYVPAPITAFGVAVLVAWLPRHFRDNYKEKGTTMSDLTNPQPKAEPLLSVGTITAGAAAVIALAVSFGAHLSQAQDVAILGAVAVLAPFIVMVVGRRKVFSPATVAKLLAERPPPAEVSTPTVPLATPPAPTA